MEYQEYLIELWKEFKKNLIKPKELENIWSVMECLQKLTIFIILGHIRIDFMINLYLVKLSRVSEEESGWWLLEVRQLNQMYFSLWKLLCAVHSIKDMGKPKIQLHHSWIWEQTLSVAMLVELWYYSFIILVFFIIQTNGYSWNAVYKWR